ncbi:MAG: LD-carboxypeptidase, partial [Clostridium sp.]
MSILIKGDKVGIVACSNGLDISMKETISQLMTTLNNIGIEPKLSKRIYKEYSAFNGTGKERADILMDFYKDNDIKAIFDISGGDLSNGILDYLDFEEINKCYKPYFGYSDLTVVINALYSKTNKKSYLYQVRNLVDTHREEQIKNFEDTFFNGKDSILNFNYKWVQGTSMEGTIVGGNIRCLLKLAGTEYIPDFQDKILFLESFGGDVPKMAAYLTQYKQMG